MLRVDNIRHVRTADNKRHVLVDVTNVGTVAASYGITVRPHSPGAVVKRARFWWVA